MNRILADKYFDNQTTASETEKVLVWFETDEGVQYLEQRFEVDRALMDSTHLRKMVPELDSEKVYTSIQSSIKKKKDIYSIKRTDWLAHTVKAAAAVLVILTASIFTISHQQYVAEQVVEREPVLFQTEDEQHREITLGDGTMVRMNSNSEIVVSEDFMYGSREITLTGEAYFDVVNDSDTPFIIHANQSTIEVLGTAFNVRSLPNQENVQVAVSEGKVAFKRVPYENSEQISVTLTKGQYGYLDNLEGSIVVDEIAVENYLAWKSGDLKFDNLSLNQVCTQLNRMYSIKCVFESERIKDLNLTAKFSNDSIEKALWVISLSLNIEFEYEGAKVIWRDS